MRIEFSAGQHIDRAAAQLVEAAKAHGSATGTFNDIEMIADGALTAEEIVAQWSRDMDAKAVAYRNSPEGKAAETMREAAITKLQETHDLALQDLRSLDWSSDIAVIDWVCRIQDATDHIGVAVRGREILDEFGRHGFEPSVNCGDAFRPDDRDNVHRYIVGQALDNLSGDGAIHGVVHKFAEDWKRRFCGKEI